MTFEILEFSFSKRGNSEVVGNLRVLTVLVLPKILYNCLLLPVNFRVKGLGEEYSMLL